MIKNSINRRQFLASSAALPLIPASIQAKAENPKNSTSAGINTDIDIDRVASNPYIQNLRDVAMNILKPSKKDYEHGMELHRNSLVIEGYGFTPYSAINGDEIRKLIDEGGTPQELLVKMEDQQRTNCLVDMNERKQFVEA